MEHLADGNWDLIIVDEAQRVSRRSQRFELLETLANSDSTPRMIFLQIVVPFDDRADSLRQDSLLANARRTLWRRADVRDWSGESLLPEARFHWVTYTRDSGEVDLTARLQDSLRSVAQEGKRHSFTYKALLQSASSSPLALEQRLE